MKITSLETELQIDPPPARPITDALRANRHPGRVVVTIRTDAGLSGRSTGGFASIRGAQRTLQVMLEEEVAPLVVGRDPFAIRQIHADLQRALEEQAIHGMTQYALTTVDVALWSILGQATGQPVHRLLGQAKDRIPAYAMVAWAHFSTDEIQEACARAVEQGFRAVKMKLGAWPLEEDVRRYEAIRAAVGKDVVIMGDVNQTFTASEAQRRGLVYQETGLFWLEEPLPARDYDGYAEVAHALALPVAAGENLYGKEEFREHFVRRGIDVAQGDLPRLGGVSEMVAAGLTAASFGVPFCTHGGGLVNPNVLCALPNAYWLESGLLSPEWLEHFQDGCVLAPEGPGFAW